MRPNDLKHLRLLVNSPAWKTSDRTEQAIRSIQQSLRVEGYVVSREAVLSALQRSTASER